MLGLGHMYMHVPCMYKCFTTVLVDNKATYRGVCILFHNSLLVPESNLKPSVTFDLCDCCICLVLAQVCKDNNNLISTTQHGTIYTYKETLNSMFTRYKMHIIVTLY